MPAMVSSCSRTCSPKCPRAPQRWSPPRSAPSSPSQTLGKNIRVPQVYWDFTTDRVLTMERVSGIRIDDVA
ncbi:AarF/UbiB family protein, partial [Mycobacterium avium]|uniref:AarF/UbiB family protein n=1 Tax=Mycobacterium avium TaxID=1764 RepID=UPI00349FB5F0